MDVYQTLAERRSVRGFEQRPVPRETLERIFGAAQRAPSWCNIQPWRVWLTAGEQTRRLTDAYTEAAKTSHMKPDFKWPDGYPEPYDTHRKACGKALYAAMGVERGDKDGRWAAWLRNFVAFGAPHVAIVCIDRRFDIYAALDVGCWLQSVLLAAWSEGVAVCPQASLASYPSAARSTLEIPEELGVLFGMALGFEDTAVAANACRTARSPLSDNLSFAGWDDAAG